jgi:hypothetical protein
MRGAGFDDLTYLIGNIKKRHMILCNAELCNLLPLGRCWVNTSRVVSTTWFTAGKCAGFKRKISDN